MPPMALFDLDNTFLDRERAFHAWARQFIEVNGLSPGALTTILTADNDGFKAREIFFAEVRQVLRSRRM